MRDDGVVVLVVVVPSLHLETVNPTWYSDIDMKLSRVLFVCGVYVCSCERGGRQADERGS